MIKYNSKDNKFIQNRLDKGLLSEKIDRMSEEKRMEELTNRVNSMIKAQDTQSQTIS
jgi:hypothetical protein